MKFVFLSYVRTDAFHEPAAWLNRIKGYTGILSYLAKSHEVESIEQIAFKGIHRDGRVNYHFVDFGGDSRYFPLQLNRYVSRMRPDVVVVHGLHFPIQLIQLRAMLTRSTRIIVQHHAEMPRRGMMKHIQQLAGRYIDAYLFVSRELAAEWISKRIIANPVKIREVMEASSCFEPMDKATAQNITMTSGNPLFLWVGRLDNNKDPFTVVRAFLKFNLAKPSSRLVMIFATEDLKSELSSLISAEPNGHSIMLAGRKTHDEMQSWYNSASFVVSSSHYEGGGIAVCEAMSCGCVPILTDIASFRKMTANGACGILYRPGSEAALIRAMFDISAKDYAVERQKTIHRFQEYMSFSAIATGISDAAFSLFKKSEVLVAQ